MIRVYCERGAYREDLTKLERFGLIQIVHFPYEGHNKRITSRAVPSVVTVDSPFVTWDDPTPIGLMVASDKFPEILDIVGTANDFDARHLDSAYKSECRCFLTPDKKDIANKSKALEQLLALKIFHATDDWNKFLSFVGREVKS